MTSLFIRMWGEEPHYSNNYPYIHIVKMIEHQIPLKLTSLAIVEIKLLSPLTAIDSKLRKMY